MKENYKLVAGVRKWESAQNSKCDVAVAGRGGEILPNINFSGYFAKRGFGQIGLVEQLLREGGLIESEFTVKVFFRLL